MTRIAVIALCAFCAVLPQASASEDPKALAATIIRDVCVTTLPDFKEAIDRAAELNLLERDSDDVATDTDTKVSLTVTGKQEVFGIPIEPLCVVNLLNHEGKDLLETAEALATDLGTEIEKEGDGTDMEDDGITWYFNHRDRPLSLTLLQDSVFGLWTSAILSLSTVGEP
ncbi:MAG: hypothetical protein AAF557_19120 [Pseudomonadota bacterium]